MPCTGILFRRAIESEVASAASDPLEEGLFVDLFGAVCFGIGEFRRPRIPADDEDVGLSGYTRCGPASLEAAGLVATPCSLLTPQTRYPWPA